LRSLYLTLVVDEGARVVVEADDDTILLADDDAAHHLLAQPAPALLDRDDGQVGDG
jgi:hypothetical protein